jgi:2-oxoglutarate dehydrogenase E2 component (dihydrolipoamide succinyltransferase)
MGTPIINLPQTAILGMHSIKERPIAVNGKVTYNINAQCFSI